MKKKIKTLLVLFNSYFDERLDFRAQIFNMLGFLGIALGVTFGCFSLYVGADPIMTASNFAAAVFAAVIIWHVNRIGKFKNYFLLTVVVVFLIIFPVLFFQGGGYNGGMPGFFVFAVAFTALMLEGRRRIVVIIVQITLYLGCLSVAYYHPESVVHFPTEADAAQDIIIGCMATAIVLAIAISRHITIYDRKQAELHELNTQLEEAKGQLEGVSRMKTEFLQNISHELKTPLTNMGNYALDTLSELKEKNLDVKEMEFNQNRIRSEGERLKRMVSQLLDVTAIEGGRVKMNMAPVSLSSLLHKAADSSRSNQENDNKLVFEITEGLPDLMVDADTIVQVVHNILSNATRHTKDGLITIGLSRPRAGWQEVRVSDTGEGIPPKVRSQVFLRYVERESKIIGRSGLGLYICKSYIDAHRGEIGIDTEAGKGTTVWFCLPESEDEGL